MRKIDKKYVTTGDITNLDGTPLPADEPLFLFRGRDRLLSEVLEHYLALRKKAGSPAEINTMLETYINEIKKWQADHPERVKTPR